MRTIPLSQNVLLNIFNGIKQGLSRSQLNDYVERVIVKEPYRYSDNFLSEFNRHSKSLLDIPESLHKNKDGLHWFFQTVVFVKKYQSTVSPELTKLIMSYYFLKKTHNQIKYDFFKEYADKHIQPSDNNMQIINRLFFTEDKKQVELPPTTSKYTIEEVIESSMFGVLRRQLSEARSDNDINKTLRIIHQLDQIGDSHFSSKEQKEFIDLQYDIERFLYHFVTIKKELYELEAELLSSENYYTIKQVLLDIDKLNPQNEADERYIKNLKISATAKLSNLEWQFKNKCVKTPVKQNIPENKTKYIPVYDEHPQVGDMLAAFYEIAQERIIKRQYGLPGTIEIPLSFTKFDYAEVKEVNGRYLSKLFSEGIAEDFDLYQEYNGEYALLQVFILANIADIVKDREIKIYNSHSKYRLKSFNHSSPTKRKYPLHKYKVIPKSKPKTKKQPAYTHTQKYNRVWHFRYYGGNFKCNKDALKRALIYTGVAYIPDGYTFVNPSPNTQDGKRLVIETQLAESFMQSLRSALPNFGKSAKKAVSNS